MRILDDLQERSADCRKMAKRLRAAREGKWRNRAGVLRDLMELREMVIGTVVPQLEAKLSRSSNAEANENFERLKLELGMDDEETDDEDDDDDDDDDEDDDVSTLVRVLSTLTTWERRCLEVGSLLMWFLAHLEPHPAGATHKTVIRQASIGGLTIGDQSKATGSVRPRSRKH